MSDSRHENYGQRLFHALTRSDILHPTTHTGEAPSVQSRPWNPRGVLTPPGGRLRSACVHAGKKSVQDVQAKCHHWSPRSRSSQTPAMGIATACVFKTEKSSNQRTPQPVASHLRWSGKQIWARLEAASFSTTLSKCLPRTRSNRSRLVPSTREGYVADKANRFIPVGFFLRREHKSFPLPSDGILPSQY